MKALDQHQVDQLINHLEQGRRPHASRNLALTRLMLDAGLRVSEACAIRDEHLRWSDGRHGWLDVDGGKGRKPGQIESVPISEHLADAIRRSQLDRPAGNTHIVWGPNGALSRWSAWDIIQQAGDQLGMRVHPHMLRHTTATTMLERGVHIRVIQRMLRHRKLDTTMQYTTVRDPLLDDAVAMM